MSSLSSCRRLLAAGGRTRFHGNCIPPLRYFAFSKFLFFNVLHRLFLLLLFASPFFMAVQYLKTNSEKSQDAIVYFSSASYFTRGFCFCFYVSFYWPRRSFLLAQFFLCFFFVKLRSCVYIAITFFFSLFSYIYFITVFCVHPVSRLVHCFLLLGLFDFCFLYFYLVSASDPTH